MTYRELFRVTQLPVLQNKMFATKEEATACPMGDVILVQDVETGLVHNIAFDKDLPIYDVDYQSEQAHSAVFRQHLSEVISIINKHFKEKTILEIGCGKGYLLNLLWRCGYQVIGLDPAYEGTDGRIIKSYFGADLGISAEGIVLRHVLEHVSNPFEFLTAIAEANGNKGKVYIEVPCFDWICQHHTWFDIYYEHVNYFRLTDIEGMFGKVLESGYLFGKQYLYVVADIASLCRPQAKDVFAVYENFFARVRTKQIDTIMGASGVQHAIWGSGSKGVIFALCMKRAGVGIDMIIDTNPAKQGKYIAGSGLRICFPEEAFAILREKAVVLVMNPMYFDEIVDQYDNNKFDYRMVG